MYTIVMKRDKSLSTTVKETLYQREKLANRIQFLVPPIYENNNLALCTAVFKYQDAKKNVQFVFLERDEELYENEMLRYILPVDYELNKQPATIIGHLSFIKTNDDGDSEFVLHTGDTKIQILPVDDYLIYASNNDGDIAALDKIIEEKIQEMLAQNPPTQPDFPDEQVPPEELEQGNSGEQAPTETDQLPGEP